MATRQLRFDKALDLFRDNKRRSVFSREECIRLFRPVADGNQGARLGRFRHLRKALRHGKSA